MSVATDLGGQPGIRARGEIRGHQQCRSPVEGERRHEHPAVSNGNEFGDAADGLLFEQLDGAVSERSRCEVGMTRARDLPTGCLSASHPLLDSQVRHDLAVFVSHPRGHHARFAVVVLHIVVVHVAVS